MIRTSENEQEVKPAYMCIMDMYSSSTLGFKSIKQLFIFSIVQQNVLRPWIFKMWRRGP